MDNNVRKKRIGFISSDPASKTGFGTCLKTLMKYLYTHYSDKYEFFVLAQGAAPNIETKERWPWHTTSVFECPVDQNRWNADPNYQRFVAYGNLAVKDWVVNNKLDFLWMVEDVWAHDEGIYLNSNWFKKISKNAVLWSTADSLPILEQFKKYSDACEFWPWANFAEKALKEEDVERFKNVTTLPGAIDPFEWKPLTSSEKEEWRAKFGIDNKTKLIIHLSRNQLRKQFYASLESLFKIKTLHPEYDTKLLIHCSWSEGWNLAGLIKEYGLDNNDILTSYFCRQCSYWTVKPFTGENQPCSHCGLNDSMITAGVNSSISNSDLSKIYGICDGSISAFTSGGLELTSVQSLLCEIPLACTDYACGTDFTCHQFIHPITGTITCREIGTNFRKHTPDINSLVKFWKKICELTPEKKEKIVKPAREWALKYFGVERIAKKVVERIEKSDFIEWSDYQGEGGRIEQYNPNAFIDSNLEGSELVDTLYKNILGMELSNEDPGRLQWIAQLSQGAPKDQVIGFFRNTAQQEIQKLSGPKSFNDLFTAEDKEKTILVGIPRSLGDCFIITSLFKGLQETYPDKQIYITCEPQYFSVFEGNPYIKKLIPWNPAFDNLFLLEGSGEHQNLVWMYFPLHGSTQRFVDYVHQNGQRSSVDLEYRNS